MINQRRLEDTETNLFRGELRDHIEEELVRDTIMSEKLLEVEKKVDELSSDIKSLLELWQQAKGIVTFVKWSASIVGFITAIILFIKDHFKW